MDIAPADHGLGEVGTGDDVSTGDLLHLLQGHGDPLLPEVVDDAEFPLVPAPLHPGAELPQNGGGGGKAVAQNVQVPVLPGPQLHPPKDGEAQGLSGVQGFLQALQAVVIGEGQDLDAPFPGQPDQLRRGILPVGGGAVGVKIRDHSDASPGAQGTPAAMSSRRRRGMSPKNTAPSSPARRAPSTLTLRSSMKKHSSGFRRNSRSSVS